MEDAALAAAAAGGDRDAFAAIYDRYADRLYDFCCAVLRDRDEAADAVQDTFLIAARRLPTLREPGRLRAWLYAIARHEAIRRGRRQSRAVPTEEIATMTPATDAAGAAGEVAPDREHLQQLVWEAAAGLSDRDRAILDLHLRQGLEGADLADALGVAPAQAYVLLSRLRDQVERSLGALLVARAGRKRCEELAKLLPAWDGRLTPLMRKRVARHVDRCPVCEEERKRNLSPLALLSSSPALAAPASLRSRVLGEAHLGSSGRRRRWRDDGFPPADARSRRPSRALLAAAAAIVLVLALIVGVGASDLGRGDNQRVESSAPSGSSDRAGRGSTTTAAVEPVIGPASGSPGVPADSDESLPSGGPAPVPPGGPSLPAVPGEQAATTIPPDVEAPVIQSVEATPTKIEYADASCAGPDTVAKVVAVVTDDSPMTVTLAYQQEGGKGGAVAMVPAGGTTWTATLGPFSAPKLDPSSVSFWVEASDSHGNASTGGAGLLGLVCTPP